MDPIRTNLSPGRLGFLFYFYFYFIFPSFSLFFLIFPSFSLVPSFSFFSFFFFFPFFFSFPFYFSHTLFRANGYCCHGLRGRPCRKYRHISGLNTLQNYMSNNVQTAVLEAANFDFFCFPRRDISQVSAAYAVPRRWKSLGHKLPPIKPDAQPNTQNLLSKKKKRESAVAMQMYVIDPAG